MIGHRRSSSTAGSARGKRDELKRPTSSCDPPGSAPTACPSYRQRPSEVLGYRPQVTGATVACGASGKVPAAIRVTPEVASGGPLGRSATATWIISAGACRRMGTSASRKRAISPPASTAGAQAVLVPDPARRRRTEVDRPSARPCRPPWKLCQTKERVRCWWEMSGIARLYALQPNQAPDPSDSTSLTRLATIAKA